MEKKAKIIATLGPAISSTSQLKKIIELGVDAFRINFSHNTKNIKNVVNKIRILEKKSKKKNCDYCRFTRNKIKNWKN